MSSKQYEETCGCDCKECRSYKNLVKKHEAYGLSYVEPDIDFSLVGGAELHKHYMRDYVIPSFFIRSRHHWTLYRAWVNLVERHNPPPFLGGRNV